LTLALPLLTITKETSLAEFSIFTEEGVRSLEGGIMLPPFIIEQIRKREQEERARYEQPQLEIPIEHPRPRAPESQDEDGNRGVIILDLGAS
jgi:hypothetical protein